MRVPCAAKSLEITRRSPTSVRAQRFVSAHHARAAALPKSRAAAALLAGAVAAMVPKRAGLLRALP
eukprot:15446756-Alexandrium_andersonii.AAC.1